MPESSDHPIRLAPERNTLDAALRQSPLFAKLSDHYFERIKKGMQLRRMTTDETLFQQGDPANFFFFLRSGQIKLFRISSEGQEKVIELIQPGGTFAEAVMFMDEKHYPVSATTIGNSRVIAFESRVYLEILREAPEYCFDLLGSMSRWLHRQIGEIDRLTLQSATYRLVAFLLQNIPVDADENCSFELSVPKRVIASRLSVQPETFSRLLQNLNRQGLISVREQTIQIHDAQRLREFAGLEPREPCTNCPKQRGSETTSARLIRSPSLHPSEGEPA